MAPGSLEFGESGPSGASFIPRHALSHLCIDPTLPCLPPPPLMLRAQPRLLALGFKLGTGLLHCCWEIPLKRLKSQWWGLIASQQSMGNSSCHFGAGGGGVGLGGGFPARAFWQQWDGEEWGLPGARASRGVIDVVKFITPPSSHPFLFTPILFFRRQTRQEHFQKR